MEEGKEAPVIAPLDNVVQRSYEALKEGRLLGIRCKRCASVGLAAYGYTCPHCGSFDVEEMWLSGNAKLLPCTTVVYPMPGIVEEPYIAATVELVEGPVITGRLYDVEGFDHDEPLRLLDMVGMDLQVDIRQETVFGREGQYCICFVPRR